MCGHNDDEQDSYILATQQSQSDSEDHEKPSQGFQNGDDPLEAHSAAPAAFTNSSAVVAQAATQLKSSSSGRIGMLRKAVPQSTVGRQQCPSLDNPTVPTSTTRPSSGNDTHDSSDEEDDEGLGTRFNVFGLLGDRGTATCAAQASEQHQQGQHHSHLAAPGAVGAGTRQPQGGFCLGTAGSPLGGAVGRQPNIGVSEQQMSHHPADARYMRCSTLEPGAAGQPALTCQAASDAAANAEQGHVAPCAMAAPASRHWARPALPPGCARAVGAPTLHSRLTMRQPLHPISCQPTGALQAAPNSTICSMQCKSAGGLPIHGTATAAAPPANAFMPSGTDLQQQPGSADQPKLGACAPAGPHGLLGSDCTQPHFSSTLGLHGRVDASEEDEAEEEEEEEAGGAVAPLPRFSLGLIPQPAATAPQQPASAPRPPLPPGQRHFRLPSATTSPAARGAAAMAGGARAWGPPAAADPKLQPRAITCALNAAAPQAAPPAPAPGPRLQGRSAAQPLVGPTASPHAQPPAPGCNAPPPAAAAPSPGSVFDDPENLRRLASCRRRSVPTAWKPLLADSDSQDGQAAAVCDEDPARSFWQDVWGEPVLGREPQAEVGPLHRQEETQFVGVEQRKAGAGSAAAADSRHNSGPLPCPTAATSGAQAQGGARLDLLSRQRPLPAAAAGDPAGGCTPLVSARGPALTAATASKTPVIEISDGEDDDHNGPAGSTGRRGGATNARAGSSRLTPLVIDHDDGEEGGTGPGQPNQRSAGAATTAAARKRRRTAVVDTDSDDDDHAGPNTAGARPVGAKTGAVLLEDDVDEDGSYHLTAAATTGRAAKRPSFQVPYATAGPASGAEAAGGMPRPGPGTSGLGSSGRPSVGGAPGPRQPMLAHRNPGMRVHPIRPEDDIIEDSDVDPSQGVQEMPRPSAARGLQPGPGARQAPLPTSAGSRSAAATPAAASGTLSGWLQRSAGPQQAAAAGALGSAPRAPHGPTPKTAPAPAGGPGGGLGAGGSSTDALRRLLGPSPGAAAQARLQGMGGSTPGAARAVAGPGPGSVVRILGDRDPRGPPPGVEGGAPGRPGMDQHGHGRPMEGAPLMANAPWWQLLPDFVPAAVLANGYDPRNQRPVFVLYRNQFTGASSAAPQHQPQGPGAMYQQQQQPAADYDDYGALQDELRQGRRGRKGGRRERGGGGGGGGGPGHWTTLPGGQRVYQDQDGKHTGAKAYRRWKKGNGAQHTAKAGGRGGKKNYGRR